NRPNNLKRKNPENRMVSGFLSCFELKSALAELRSTTGGFEAVLLSLLHSRVAGQETSSLEGRTILIRICLQQGTRDAVTDCASLAGEATANDGALDVELIGGVRCLQRLTNDQLQGIEAEVIVDGAVVDLDLTGTAREQTNSCNRGLSSAG